MSELRTRLIRLAHDNPELRGRLLPLLKDAGCEKLPEGGMRDNCEKKKEEGEKKEGSLRSAAHLYAILDKLEALAGTKIQEGVRFSFEGGQLPCSISGWGEGYVDIEAVDNDTKRGLMVLFKRNGITYRPEKSSLVLTVF
jgi:hypothetical protein